MPWFNEIDPFCAEWLEALYPGAAVERRSIHEVRGADVVGLARRHYFAGVGGWEHALQLAGWPDEWPVWTGSCPCQPLSCAGRRGGEADERHLWPEFHRLIGECRPPVVLGEQVASKDGVEWLDGVSLDLEEIGYAVGAADLPAACVGAPHVRQRLFWVAVAPERQRRVERAGVGRGEAGTGLGRNESDRGGPDGWLADNGGERPQGGEPTGGEASGLRQRPAVNGHADGLGHALAPGREGRGAGVRGGPVDRGGGEPPAPAGGSGGDGGAGHAQLGGRDGLHERGEPGHLAADLGGAGAGDVPNAPSGTPWSDCLAIPCRDGKLRRVSAQPGDEPLAHGIPARADDPRMGYLLARLAELGHDSRAARRILREARRNRIGRLRGYGNAIVPVIAAEFVRAVMEVLAGTG